MYEYAPDAMIDSSIWIESILYSHISKNFGENKAESDIIVHRVFYSIEFTRKSIHIIDYRGYCIGVDLEYGSLIDGVR